MDNYQLRYETMMVKTNPANRGKTIGKMAKTPSDIQRMSINIVSIGHQLVRLENSGFFSRRFGFIVKKNYGFLEFAQWKSIKATILSWKINSK